MSTNNWKVIIVNYTQTKHQLTTHSSLLEYVININECDKNNALCWSCGKRIDTIVLGPDIKVDNFIFKIMCLAQASLDSKELKIIHL